MTLSEAAVIFARHECFYCAHSDIPVQVGHEKRGTGKASIHVNAQHSVTWANGETVRVWCDARRIWSALDKASRL